MGAGKICGEGVCGEAWVSEERQRGGTGWGGAGRGVLGWDGWDTMRCDKRVRLVPGELTTFCGPMPDAAM